MINIIKKIQTFIRDEIWKTPLQDKSKLYSFLIRQIRIIILAWRGFLEERISMRASALTLYTLFSIVPIVAMVFGVAKGFGFENKMEEIIIENFKGQKEVMNWIIDLSYSVLENVEGGVLAGIGLVILIWSVMQVLTHVERSFNAIWHVKKSRSFIRQLSDYLAIMLIAPLLIIVSSSFSVYLSTRIETVAQNMELVKTISPLIESIFSIIPYALIWLLFTLLYVIMPNTRVSFKYAVIAGILAGTAFQIIQWLYIHFQVGVTRYSALYGTFAALPLFLAWLQISWLIVLLGAEIAFAYQNIEQYEFEVQSVKISQYNKRLMSLFITHYIIKKFESGSDPPTSTQISRDLEIPFRLIRDLLFDLVQARIINETLTSNPKETGYQPAIDINKIDINYVIDHIDNIGRDQLVVKESKDFLKLSSLHRDMMKSLMTSDANMLLKNI